MKVLIINPPNIWKYAYTARAQNRWLHSRPKGRFFRQQIFPTYPLLLTYAGAELEKAGFEVKIVDAAFRELSINQVGEKALKFESDLIALEIASNSFDVDMKTARHLKELMSSAHITVIGTHATVFPEETLNENSFLDTVVYGEFFITLRVLAECIRDGTSLIHVEGLVYRDGNKVVKNPPRPWINSLDDLPLPARHLVLPGKYYLTHYTYKPQIMMMTSLGCPHQCIFCLWPKTIGGHKFRPREPKKIADEVEVVIRDWGAKEIYFDDDTFNVTVQHAMGVSNELIRRGIKLPWITQARVDNIPFELLQMMKRAGCVKILYGVESGSQEIIDNIRKRITIEQVRETFRLTHQVGIKSHATFMIGLLGETEETIEESLVLAKDLDCDTIQVSVAQPFPGTTWHKMCEKYGTLTAKTWTDYDGELGGSHVVPGLTDEYIIESVGRFYKEFHIRPRHLMNRVLGIRSWADIDRFYRFGLSFIRRFSIGRLK